MKGVKEVKKVHKLIEYIDDTMQEYEDKVARGGDLSSKDVECLKDLAKTKIAILTNEAMEESGDYSRENRGGRSNRSYDNNMSYARGRGRYAKRDSMGRYSNDYSYDNAKEDMMSELTEIMKKAPDETTKRKFQKFMDEMQEV